MLAGVRSGAPRPLIAGVTKGLKCKEPLRVLKSRQPDRATKVLPTENRSRLLDSVPHLFFVWRYDQRRGTSPPDGRMAVRAGMGRWLVRDLCASTAATSARSRWTTGLMMPRCHRSARACAAASLRYGRARLDRAGGQLSSSDDVGDCVA